VALAAQAPAGTGATGPKAVKKSTASSQSSKAPQPVTIPADAKANPDGSYAWTDKQGKKWTYVQTPFGVVRSETPADSATPSSLAGAKAFDAGDKVRFEKPSPFGVVKWEKNKADLTDEERRLVDSQKAKQD
jgi:hypothetical protein